MVPGISNLNFVLNLASDNITLMKAQETWWFAYMANPLGDIYIEI